jgi:hypothetical protein
MTGDILRIAKAANTPQPIVDDLEDIFKDFREKNQKRNQCLHWIWSSAQEVDAPSYKPNPQKIPFTAVAVNELADDLVWIETRLESHTMSEIQLQQTRKTLGEEADLYAPAPWLNIPPQPGPKR